MSVRVMGHAAELIESMLDTDGIIYKLYRDSDGATVFVKDVDADAVISCVHYPSIAHAIVVFTAATKLAIAVSI
jgi:hypothetical protein